MRSVVLPRGLPVNAPLCGLLHRRHHFLADLSTGVFLTERSVSAFVAFGHFLWPFSRRAFAFSPIPDLSALDEPSVLRYEYLVVITFEESVKGS